MFITLSFPQTLRQWSHLGTYDPSGQMCSISITFRHIKRRPIIFRFVKEDIAFCLYRFAPKPLPCLVPYRLRNRLLPLMQMKEPLLKIQANPTFDQRLP